jgi:hypothetical protein
LVFILDCWKLEPDERPNVQEVVSALKAIKSLGQCNTKIKPHSKVHNLEPSELINFIKCKRLVKFINMDELSTMINIDEGHFGTISKTIWKKTNDFVICKRIKNIQSIDHKQNEAFLHELDMHRRLDFCSRIIRILGISFGKFILKFFF